MRPVGLHIRVHNSIRAAAHYAAALDLPLFQCFFIDQETGNFLVVSKQERDIFLRDYRALFSSLFLHGSYWINLALHTRFHYIFKRELELAKQLEFTHMVLHPGSLRNNKQKGLEAIARMLNALLKEEHTIRILLENTAHAGASIGGDLQDFFIIKSMLDHPEKLLFCIDTAHAHSYGYDLISQEGQTDFIACLERTVGINQIALIHLNDTNQKRGSRIDQHEILAQGQLGTSLHTFLLQPALTAIPLILELPLLPAERERELVQLAQKWTIK